jgi:chromate transporter
VTADTEAPPPAAERVPLLVIAREWGRIGCIGFGGPPAHIALLRQLCVQRRGWMTSSEFEDGVAATNLLPGPASTQLAIFCAWRLAGTAGALIGGLCFIVPGLIVILGLSVLFLAHAPPAWVTGAAAGAGAAVPAVAVSAAVGLIPASWQRAGTTVTGRSRWIAYLVVGALAADLAGEFVVAALVGCGLAELLVRRPPARVAANAWLGPLVSTAAPAVGGLASLAWVAIKVGALSFGGGFVIIPLMRADAVGHHWMTSAQFLNAVALGQITPGPVVQTVAAVGYAAGGVGGGLLAALIAFSPSFVFVLGGARYFTSLRGNKGAQAFLDGAGPAAIGAILGSAIPLTTALTQPWQYAVLAGALLLLLGLRRGVVFTLLTAGAAGLIVSLVH